MIPKLVTDEQNAEQEKSQEFVDGHYGRECRQKNISLLPLQTELPRFTAMFIEKLFYESSQESHEPGMVFCTCTWSVAEAQRGKVIYMLADAQINTACPASAVAGLHSRTLNCTGQLPLLGLLPPASSPP